MDLSRLNTRRAIIGATAAVALAASLLFLPWFSLAHTVSRTQGNPSYSPDSWVCGVNDYSCTGFETFSILRWLLLLGCTAPIVLAMGPMLSDLWPAGARALTQGRAYLAEVFTGLKSAGDTRVTMIEFPNQDGASAYGCKHHPSAETQRRMAEQLTAHLREQMGW